MYAKIYSDSTIKYPYTITDLKIDNPNISFSSYLDKDTLNSFGMIEVSLTEKPEDYTKNISEDMPVFINGVLTQSWKIEDATSEQINDRIMAKWVDIRSDRDKDLISSDWTQLADSPLSDEQKNAWRQYRQELRDITNQADPFSVVFPTSP